jgi:hypothetical protein
MSKQPYIEMLANRIDVLMHYTEFEEKYPGGIRAIHNQIIGSPIIEFEFSHNGIEIKDSIEINTLKDIFYELMGDNVEEE